MTDSSSINQVFIRKLTDIVLANLGNANFGVKELAHESGISLYRLNRRLRSINRKTTRQFIQELRLQKALEMLQNEESMFLKLLTGQDSVVLLILIHVFMSFSVIRPEKLKREDRSPGRKIFLFLLMLNRKKKHHPCEHFYSFQEVFWHL